MAIWKWYFITDTEVDGICDGDIYELEATTRDEAEMEALMIWDDLTDEERVEYNTAYICRMEEEDGDIVWDSVECEKDIRKIEARPDVASLTLTEIVTKTYTWAWDGHTAYVDIQLKNNLFECYLEVDNMPKDHMFGLPVGQTNSFEEAKAIVEGNLPVYMEDYLEEHDED